MKRTIKVISVLDEHVINWEDDGIADRGGTPLPRRRRIIDALGERVALADASGKVRKVQVFQLAEAPSVEDEDFDAQYLKAKDGEWLKPSATWLELRELRCAKRRDDRAALEDVHRRVVAEDITAGIRELAKSAVESATTSTPSRKAPK